jgi:hypothetical protein
MKANASYMQNASNASIFCPLESTVLIGNAPLSLLHTHFDVQAIAFLVTNERERVCASNGGVPHTKTGETFDHRYVRNQH